MLSAVYPLDDTGEAAFQVHRNQHEGKIGVLCLAPGEGLGIDDPGLRARRWVRTGSRSSGGTHEPAGGPRSERRRAQRSGVSAASSRSASRCSPRSTTSPSRCTTSTPRSTTTATRSGPRSTTARSCDADGVEEALLKVADSYIQLLTPTTPDSPVAKCLEKRGEGLHHVGYRVDDCAAALQAVKAAGGRAIDDAPRPGSRGTTVAFVHPKGRVRHAHRARPGVRLHTDLLLDPFGGRVADAVNAAKAAEDAGFDGIWTWDHLAGRVHGASHVLECWTLLTTIAAHTERVAVGPLVLNVANREPGVVAVMAATLQEASGGRLLLGIGAGGGPGTPYPDEQRALGRAVPGDATRRAAVDQAVEVIRDVWTGRDGFLRPDPPPPIVVGGFGPKMAALAGKVGDGFNTPASHPQLAELIAIATREHAGSDFVVTASASLSPRWVDEDSGQRARSARSRCLTA